MLAGPKRVRIYTQVNGRKPFADWLDGLGPKIETVVLKRIRRLEQGLLGDFASVGQRVLELRIHAGPGYRIYAVDMGDLLVLLSGGEKNGQSRDIAKAKEYQRDYEVRRQIDAEF